MNKETQFVAMSDGKEVFVRLYQPTNLPKAKIHILHGMGEHSGRYDEFATFLCENGYFVTVHDHRGHGKTAELHGKLGFIANENGFDKLVQDSVEILETFKHETIPTILFGHSMGSFVARKLIQQQSEHIDRCILCGTSSTGIHHFIGNQLSKTLARKDGKDVPSKLMNKLSFGPFNNRITNPKTPFDWLTTDEKELENYLTDPYCGFIPSHQFFVDLTEGLLSIQSKKENERIRKNLPIFLISGAEDPVGQYSKGVYQVARQFEQVGLKDVTVYLFEKMRHEPLHERNKQYVYHVILRWLEKYEQEK